MTPSSKNKNRFRDWAKPALFTATLYLGLAGGYFFYKKTTDNSIASLNPSATPATTNGGIVGDNISVDDVGDKETVVDISIPEPQIVIDAVTITQSQNEQITNARIFAKTSNNTTTTISSLSHKKPTQPLSDLPLPELSSQEPVSIEPQSDNNSTQADPKNSKEGIALTEAEAEAEVQNELLREAINRVRTLNDNKIAQSDENASIPQSPINQDESEQDNAPKQSPTPPKIEKQVEKVVIDQDVSLDLEDTEVIGE